MSFLRQPVERTTTEDVCVPSRYAHGLLTIGRHGLRATITCWAAKKLHNGVA